MADKDHPRSTLAQIFGVLEGTKIRELLLALGVDKYVKKLRTMALIQLVALAQIMQLTSLRDTVSMLNNAGLSQHLAIESLSASQLSRRLRSLPPEVPRLMLNVARLEAATRMGMNAVAQGLGRLHLIDSTTITLCVKQYGWAKFRLTKSGVKVHLGLVFINGDVVPNKVTITHAKVSDMSQLDLLITEDKDALHVYDRGYNDYGKFDEHCANSVRFVTRLKENAVVEIVEDRPLEPESTIKRDATVYLGIPGKNKMVNQLRMLETEDSEGKKVVILTNDFRLSAQELCDIYRLRWQIELFFKWIKQHFFVKRFYGRSDRAVVNQLYIALVTYCLLVLIKLKTGYGGSLLTVYRLVKACMCEPFESFTKKLLRKPQRSSRGRRKKVDHDAVYQDIMRQVIAGEADYLNDLVYDPMIL